MSWRERQALKEREGGAAPEATPRSVEPVEAAPAEGRRRLNLAPRTLPKSETPEVPAASEEAAAPVEERRAPATGGAYRPPGQRATAGASPTVGSPAPYRRPGADREAPASGTPPYRRGGDREGAPAGEEGPKKYVPPSQRQGGWRK